MKTLRYTSFLVLLLIAGILKADVEPNNSIAEAEPAALGTVNGSIDGTSDFTDYYVFALPANGEVQLSLSTVGLQARLRIYNASGFLLNSSGYALNNTVVFNQNCVGAGTFYVQVERNSGGGTYSFDIALAQPAEANDAEPNNSIATSIALPYEGTVTGQMGYSNSAATPFDATDVYHTLPVEEGRINLTATLSGTLQARIRLYNAEGFLLLSSAYTIGGTTTLAYDCLAPDTLYVEMEQNSGCGGYTLSYTWDGPAFANDAEPNNTFGEAVGLTGPNATGRLGYANGSDFPLDNLDYYSFVPAEEGRATLRLITTNSLQARLRIFNNGGGLLNTSGYVTADTAFLTLDCMAPDTFYIEVDQNSGCGAYRLSTSYEVPLYANDAEPNNSLSETSSIAGFVEQTGRLGYGNLPDMPFDINDYYQTVTPTNGNINIRLITTNTLQGRVVLYNKDLTLLGSSGYVTNDTTSLNISCLREDTAYIWVDQNSGCGAYRLLYTVDSPDVARDLEPNNSFDDAIFIGQGLGSGRTGHIGFVNGFSDQDDYYFGVPTLDGKIRIRIINDGAQQSRVVLYNDDRNFLGASAYSTDTVFLEYDSMDGGDTIYFNVDNNSGCGGYRLSYEIVPNVLPNDPEPNNTTATARSIAENTARAGHLGYANGSDNPIDGIDFYRARLADDGRVNIISVSNNSLQSRIILYSKGGTLLASSSYVVADTATLSYDCLAADTVYFAVQRASGCGGYTIAYDLVSPDQANDAEPNNSIAEAAPLASNTQQGGHLGYFNTPIPTDFNDYYAYNPQDTGLLHIQVISTNTLQNRLLIYNSAGLQIGSTGYVVADTINFFYNAPSGDTLYYRVERASGCGGYTIEVDNGCAQPTGITEDLIISIGAQLEWDDMPDAVGGYNIMGRRQGGANFQVGLGIPNSRYRAFPLQSCETYEYKVESVCATRTSGYTPLRPFTTLCSPFCPALTGVNVDMITSSSVRVRWANSVVNTGTQLQYTPVGGSTQTATAPGGQNFINLSGLMAGTTYDYMLRQSCYDGGISPFVSGSFSTATLREDGSFSALLFPNPAMDRLSVQGLEDATPAVVVNAQGQVVLQVQLQAGTSTIDVSGLAPGQYALRLTGETQNNTMRFAIVR